MSKALLHLGDKIALTSGGSKGILESLWTDTFTIVGVIRSPLYISPDRGTTSIGNGQVSAFMQIPDIDFKSAYFSGVYVTAKMDSKIEAYSKKYDDKIDPVKSLLDNLSTQRAAVRFQEIKTESQNTLNQNLQEYNNSLADANTKLADAAKKIADGQAQIDSGKKTLATSKADAEKTFADSQAQLTAGKVTLSAAQADFETKWDAFNKQKQMAIAAGVYEAQKAVFDANEAQLNAAKQQLDSNAADLAAKQALLDSSKADAEKLFATKKTDLEKAQTDLNQSKLDYEKGKAESDQKLADAKVELDKGQTKINELPAVTWHVLGRDTNIGYVDYGTAADRMDAIAQVFPIIFILVAILICFTSMSRMVEEQRMFIGTAKALGYTKTSIAGKFLLYAILSSIIGGLIGFAFGFTFFPSTIFKAYSTLYSLPKFILIFDFPFAAIAIGSGILVTSLSALLVCLSELNSNAAALMRPRAPKAGKIILLERIQFLWKRMKFTQKVTARNFFRYKSRFFMTVIGVGGCTALLLVGFGLNDAISAIGSKQFGKIYTYQLSVNLTDKASVTDVDALKSKLRQQPEFADMTSLTAKSIDVGFQTKEKSCGLVVPQDAATISKFITLQIRAVNQKVPLTDSGVILTEKLATMLGVKIGETITIKNGDAERLSVQVTGICENYLQHYVYMSPTLYEKTYHAKPVFNQLDIKLKTTADTAQEEVSKNIASLGGVSSVNLMKDSTERFKNTIKTIYSIVLVLIFSAGLLSFIVLYTLTNININERLREIATIKVLGFYDNEVSAYVFRENLILTLIGTAFGLLIGMPLAHYVIGTCEVDLVMFGRQIYPLSFLIAAALTMLFAWIVNLVMLRTLRKINMVEALKTVE